jgi:hypothetical protein
MGALCPGGDKLQPERRTYYRFTLTYPVHIHFRAHTDDVEVEATSQNVSSGGILLRSPSFIPLHTSITSIMSMQRNPFALPVHLLAEGEVVRLHKIAPGSSFLIAVCFSAPVTELESHSKFLLIRPEWNPTAE